jgi:septal ring factor EnvC (AmiA/AmiB activator)
VRHRARFANTEGASRIGPPYTPDRDSARLGVHFARLLLLAAFSGVLIAAQAAGVGMQDPQIEGHKRDLAEVQRRVRDLEQDLRNRRDRRKHLLTELERSEHDIADLARAGRQLTAMIAEQQRALEKLGNQLAVERDGLSRERTDLGSLLRSAHAMGPGDRIRMLLDQENATRLSRAMAYYDFLNRFHVGRIEAIVQRARRLEELAREMELEKERLSVLAQKQQETRARMAVAQEGRTALLAFLEQTIATRAEGIEDLRAQAREMRLLLEQLERRARALPEAELHQEPLTKLRGRLSWPLAGAQVLSRYGSPKGDGAQRWDGVILKAEEGTQVRAIYYGRVVYADWLRGFGLLLIIEHDDDYMSLYGHNQTLLKEAGEWVAPGDIIALSGSSGGRASPGLYFAIRYRGGPLNPELWCRHGTAAGRASSATGIAAMERIGVSLFQSVDSYDERHAQHARHIPLPSGEGRS